MIDSVDTLAGLIALNGRQMVGKTRLQKVLYLLKECGFDFGFDFDYHHFGPYSVDLAQAVDDALDLSRISVEERLGYHQVPYALYRTEEPVPEYLGTWPADAVRDKLMILHKFSALELEVAATIVYLRKNGYGEAAVEETKVRKSLKATDKRVSRALELVSELNLED